MEDLVCLSPGLEAVQRELADLMGLPTQPSTVHFGKLSENRITHLGLEYYD